MIKAEIPFLTMAELSELIRQKEVSPVEVTESYLEASTTWTSSSTRNSRSAAKMHLQLRGRRSKPLSGGTTLGRCMVYQWR